MNASPDRARILAVQAGGMLGPLAGGLVSPILWPIAESFDTTTDAAATSLTAYFIPFAALLVVSGTLGERWGRARVVQWAYVLFVVALVLATLAPSLPWFLAARALQGFANAFTTPLLVAGLSEMVTPERRSRAIGVFASFQAGGQSLAALVAGVAASVNWRLAFLPVAVVAAAFALVPPPGAPRRGAAAPQLRALLNLPMGLLCAVGFVTFAGAAGIPFLVALHAQRAHGLDVTASGLVLATFGLVGLVAGRTCGSLVGQLGAVRCGVWACVTTGGLVAACGLVPSTVALTVCWGLAGGSMALLNVSLQSITLDANPNNRSGGTSLVAALRFAGSAAAPLIWLPLFVLHPAITFAAVGASTVLAALALVGAGRHLRA